jgi:hypothetical protein
LIHLAAGDEVLAKLHLHRLVLAGGSEYWKTRFLRWIQQ